jgi:hypothetical protein
MTGPGLRFVAFALWAAVAIFLPAAGLAQSGGDKPAQANPPADAAHNGTHVDEITEVAKSLTGPAGNPECVWLGRKVVSLLWNDDMDTAFRHLDLYDRFGCPGGHIQDTFRCLIRQGDLDPKQDKLATRVQACWINPALQPPAPPAPPQPAAAAAPPTTPPGTTPR